MASIRFSVDGLYQFVAAEISGVQKVLRAATSDLATWEEVYSVTGTACNVMTGEDEDTMYFYGNFGTDVVLIKYTISTDAIVDISPPSIGANIINAFAVNPTQLSAGFNEMAVQVSTSNVLLYSADGGTTWTTWDATTVINGNAIELVWQSTYIPHGYLLGGDTGGAGAVYISPNEGASKVDVTDTIVTLNICGLQWIAIEQTA